MAKKKQKKQLPHLDLIDGNNWANRAFYAVGFGKLDNGKGFNTNAIKGFNTMIMSLINRRKREGIKDHRICVAFDVPSFKTFRHDLIEEWVESNPKRAITCGMVKPDDKEHSHSYKGNRSKDPEVADSMREQIKWIQRYLKASGICVVIGAPYEADDYLGSIAYQNQDNAIIELQSRDKDFAQVAVEGKVTHVMPAQGKLPEVRIGNDEECIKHFGVKVNQIIEYLMLCGDKVDNITGVDGIGSKTAVGLLNEYGKLSKLKAVRKDIKGTAVWKRAMRGDKGTKGILPPFSLTRKLARIKIDIEDLPSMDDMRMGEIDGDKIRKLKKKFKMTSLMFT